MIEVIYIIEGLRLYKKANMRKAMSTYIIIKKQKKFKLVTSKLPGIFFYLHDYKL